MSGRIRVEPCDPGNIQPSSVAPSPWTEVPGVPQLAIPVHRPLRVSRVGSWSSSRRPPGSRSCCIPGSSYWGPRPNSWSCRRHRGPARGKSSLGRLGLLIHSTAGYVDPGWSGTLTLELSNVANLPIVLTPGMPIGQISFTQMTTPVDRPYGTPGWARATSTGRPDASQEPSAALTLRS